MDPLGTTTLIPSRNSAATALGWLREGRRVAIALLADVEDSAPMQPGAMLFADDSGRVEGSITGGCVEGAVVTEARELLEAEADAPAPARLVTYGISDELAGTVGLTCGGTVHVLVHAVAQADEETLAWYLESLVAGRPVALATVLQGSLAGRLLAVSRNERRGSLGGPQLMDSNVEHDVRGALAQGHGTIRHYGPDGARLGAEIAVHVTVHGDPAQLVIVGAIDFAAALAALAPALGYDVTIGDPRRTFLDSPRFIEVAKTTAVWPQELLADRELGPSDAILVLSHDPKLDVPAVLAALETGAGYIGALGSRRTTADRHRRLLEAGADPAQLERLHAPCGLDIGAATPEQTAIAILAEIIADRAGRGGGPLRAAEGPIRAERIGLRSARGTGS
jgi:xanthine dehydrogenase accessory factor